MIEEQPTHAVTIATLVPRVQELRGAGWRMAQIGATLDGASLELNYSFDRNQSFLNLRLTIPAQDARVPSVSYTYGCAFLYENEIHDLYGVVFEGLSVDYKGQLYKLARPFPFAPGAAKPATP